MTDGAGAVTRSYDYDAFGNETAPDAEDTNPFRYCGEYWDAETGTYYLRARYYAPDIGRFTQQDHVQHVKHNLPNGSIVIDSLSLNLYTYCAGNPIAYADPSGNAWEFVLDLVSLGSSALTFKQDPALLNAAYLLWDFGGVLVPLVPGSYVAKGARLVAATDNADDGLKIIASLDNYADLFRAITKRPDSKILRSALEEAYKKMGKELPSYAYAAHHIVAGGAQGATKARMVLAKFGIDVNDVVNGVLLPSVKGVGESTYHNTLHTAAYYEKVNLLLESAQSRDEVITILKQIAEALLNGTF